MKVSLQETLLFFQIFRKCLLKRYFLNCFANVEKTTLYLGLFFKLHFFKIFFISLLFFEKLPLLKVGNFGTSMCQDFIKGR